ncbi:MAG TPA: FtsX-like permease family protein [Actinomycetota bacterium]|nr:FtsX-like permease family protein [Actinomycetota bacterium]
MTPLVPFLVVFALIGYQALRRPVLRRLAFRDAVRRPTETMLVIAGSLLGTALITGSLIVGDTLDASVRVTATTQLGPVDEIVQAPDEDTADRLVKRLNGLDEARIDGVTSLVTTQSAIASDASGRRLAEPSARLIELDFEDARTFGRDRAATGLRGGTPSEGEIVIAEDLGEALEAGRGDRVTAYLYGRKLRFEVVRVLPQLGLAGFWKGFETTSMNAFAAPGTLRSVARDAPKGTLPPEPIVLVSNRGGVEEGERLTTAVTGVIEDAFPPGASLRVESVKRDRIERADREGEAFGEIFLAIGAFAIVAGVLLLVNIFVMLAEERKSQLGMLRAIGMKRSHLVRLFVIEGAIYSFASAILGAVVGIGVGWAIVRLAAPIFSGFDAFSVDLLFSVESSSIITGLSVGGLISVITVTGTSLRTARINIIRAIRELPEPRTFVARRRNLILGLAAALLSGVWFAIGLGDQNGWPSAIAGPPLVAFSLTPVLARFVARRTALLAISAFALVWGIFGNAILDDHFFEAGEIFAFVLQGVLLTFSAVIFLSQLQETLEGFLRRIAAKRLALRLSIAYPLARRVRTGLTLGMFALVIFTMVFISTLSNVFGGQVDTATEKEGGFELLVDTNESNPPSEKELEAQRGVEQAVSLLSGAALWQPEGFTQPLYWPVSGIDRRFVAGGPPTLSDRDESLSSDAEVWKRLLRDDSAVVIPQAFLQSGGGPPENLVEVGDTIALIDPLTGKRRERTVIGKVENDYAFSGVYFSKRALQSSVSQVTLSRFYIHAEGSPEELKDLAARIQGRFVANGADAGSFRAIVEEFQQISLQFLKLMQAYLALGLLVGIAGLGVVMVRAVRERRREVGVLRALGFLARQVRAAFVLESGFVALEGILVGVVLALITAAQLISSGDFGENIDFMIPWGQLSLLTGTALVAAVMATAWPAQQASLIAPAEALRIAD